MSALSIGFDTIIVGALALPWVLLVLHLFFSENESSVQALVDWVNKQSQPAWQAFWAGGQPRFSTTSKSSIPTAL